MVSTLYYYSLQRLFKKTQNILMVAKMLKLFCSSLVLNTVFWVNFSALAQPIPKLRQGMTYEDARTLLIEQGWQAILNMAQFNNPERGVIRIDDK